MDGQFKATNDESMKTQKTAIDGLCRVNFSTLTAFSTGSISRNTGNHDTESWVPAIAEEERMITGINQNFLL